MNVSTVDLLLVDTCGGPDSSEKVPRPESRVQERHLRFRLGTRYSVLGNNILAESGGSEDDDADDYLQTCFRIPHDYPPRRLCVLTAYLDETGHESKGHVFIAGFVGNDEQWNALRDAWRIGLGKRKALHMSDLRWSHVNRVAPLLARLGPLPVECGLERVLGGVRVRDYEDLVVGPIEAKLQAGYISALFPLVVQILRWVPSDERIELVFEEQKQYQPMAELVLAEVANNSLDPQTRTSDTRSKLASWRFVPKGSTVLTEPADYFAYALGQAYKDRQSERTRLCLPILGNATSTAIGAVMSRQQIRDTIQKTKQAVRLDAILRAQFKPKNSEEMLALRATVERIVLAHEEDNDSKKGG